MSVNPPMSGLLASGPAAKIDDEAGGLETGVLPDRAGLVHSSFVRLSDAAQPQLLVDLRRHSQLHARRADPHRHRAGDALHAACRHGVQFGRAHHARRQLRLAAALRARQRRVDVLPRRLYPYVPRHVLRLLQGAARGAVDPRRHHLSADDGDRLHGLRAAVGPDELLGRDRHHQPVLGHPGGRRSDRDLAVGRLLRSATRRCSASSRCITCCRS